VEAILLMVEDLEVVLLLLGVVCLGAIDDFNLIW
jgi:hypothetical protein